uniref:Uncharacterized protein n=1 Tax=Anguilla anguilla TaxID=7936 RepID=A0A0E9TZB3_ANGAN
MCGSLCKAFMWKVVHGELHAQMLLIDGYGSNRSLGIMACVPH